LEELCKLDPEYTEAQTLLAEARQLAGSANHSIAKACANALTYGHSTKNGMDDQLSSWAKNVHEARIALDEVRSGDYQQIEKAEYFIHKALIDNPDTSLAAVVHLRLIDSKAAMPKLAIRSLAQIYHERWPDCLQFLLTLSDELMESGESNLAVNMLHQAVSRDLAGQVPRRMWGNAHQYVSMWPVQLEASNTGPNSPQNIPIPAAVASWLGWNQIAAMNSTSDDNEPSTIYASSTPQETVKINPVDLASTAYIAHAVSDDTLPQPVNEQTRDTQSKLEQMADELKRPHLAREDSRFPVYVVFSTRGGLESQYDSTAFQTIDAELKKLVSLIHGKKLNGEYWGSLLFYADDIAYTKPFDLQPAPYNDPWKLKLLLANLDTALEKRGERIGSLLIIGGPEIVPFHNLPNPVEDADTEVPSDNPYATKDTNYFISDWPVGRISGGTGTDPTQLIGIIQDIIKRYNPKVDRFAWYTKMVQYIQELIRRGISKQQSSFGYTAAVWRLASLSVFRTIGNQNDMLISPPIHACDCPDPVNPGANQLKDVPCENTCLLLPQSRLAYFNLHGVPDGSEWYGQSDPAIPENGPDFPIAMRPQDIKNGGSAPRLVFTEACYGANILEKNVDEAISLKYLVSGTHAVIGSTCISYGSLASPLSSADLLGRVFWSLLQEGFTAGESLRRAKIHLTREMNNRQGFLDAEDQKTLISFVLFGDPLAQPYHKKTNPKTTPHLSDSAVVVPTVCEHSSQDEKEVAVSIETISHLKNVVAQYLPGMNDAEVSLSQEHQTCSTLCGHCKTGKRCGMSQTIGETNPTIKSQRRIVTLSKNFERAQKIHRQYARLTLDEGGKIVKMVVSH
jgi:hypothetical protein